MSKIYTEKSVQDNYNLTPLMLIREEFERKGIDPKEPSYRFDFDPKTHSRYKNDLKYQEMYRKEFRQYLHDKCLTIDIWDSNSKFYFGSIKISLRDLIR